MKKFGKGQIMSIKLIAMDLDGTLLTSERLVSERTIKTLKAARERGVHLTIATGRMMNSAEHFGSLIGADVPLISCNGSLVQKPDEDEPLFCRRLPDEVAQKLLTLCHERGWYCQWYVGRSIYAEKYLPEFFQAYRTIKNFKVIEVGERYLDYAHNVIQCVVRDLDGGIWKIAEEISAVFPNEVWLQQRTGTSTDITMPGVNKALGLQALMDHLGLGADEVMACGDSDNDVSMLELAKTAVVPANGLPMAKAKATFLAPSHDEDGIAVAIEKLVLA